MRRVLISPLALGLMYGCGETQSAPAIRDGGDSADAPRRPDAGIGHDGSLRRDVTIADDANRRDSGRDASLGCDAGEPGVTCLASSGAVYANTILAVDDQSVFWAWWGPGATQDGIRRVARTGGAATTLASGLIEDMVSDGVNLYWGQGGGPNVINRVPVMGGATVSLATAGAFRCIAADTENVYWTDQGVGTGTGIVAKVSKAGGEVTTLVAGGHRDQFSIAVDDTSVYWTDGSLMRVAKNGGTPVTLLSAPRGTFDGCRTLAVVGGTLYLTSSNTNEIISLPTTGDAGAPTVLSSGTGAYAIVAGPTGLFSLALGTNLEVQEMALDGGAITTLATPVANSARDLALASDGTLYWTTNFQVQSLVP